jgi:hypothetical protein
LETPRAPKKRRRRPKADASSTAIWDGLRKPPSRPETLRESLLYPLWGATGVSMLVALPPLLWITSVPTIGAIQAIAGLGWAFHLGLVLLLVPFSLGLAVVLGYMLLFLGRVLASSAAGEMHHPHTPDWDLDSIAFGLGRWAWAALVGGVVGGFPATVYWVYCGDVDLFDVMILAELAALGAVYGLMALLASILHDDPLAANPATVVSAIVRVGWGYATPCLLAGGAVVAAGAIGYAAFMVDRPAAAAFLWWLFWFVALYEAMVVLRVLGLFYHRRARTLGWFRDRRGWGV